MYAAYFGLKHEPFSIAPDPRYLFMSERHREALAHLLYGLGGGGGFVLLTGEIGTGKTSVCRLFLERIPASCNVAYIFNPKLTVIELLQSVCDEFHIEVPARHSQPLTVKDYIDPLNAFLLQAHAAGRNNVLIIDEAQNLSAPVLEQLRLLTNLETSERKLLQIILIGQPELRDMLARPELEQLAQRVIARYHLDALTPQETSSYIRHRLEVAGLDRPMPFNEKSMRRIHRLARGVPRRINLLCDRALLGAFAHSQGQVDQRTIDQAADEVLEKAGQGAKLSRRSVALLALSIGLATGVGLLAGVSQLSRLGEATPPMVAPRPSSVVSTAADSSVRAAPQQALAGASSMAVTATADAAATASPREPALFREQDQAWRELAQAWGVQSVQGQPCKTLPAQQLNCFSKVLSLSAIRELSRPGIVTLDAPGATARYALLTGLTRDTATLRAAGTEQTVTLTALAARWQGDFATLWRAPAGFDGRHTDGGPQALAWLAQRLAAPSGLPAASAPVAAPALFASRLRSFQLAHGLAADGVPGPMTYMQINRVAGVPEPRLRTQP